MANTKQGTENQQLLKMIGRLLGSIGSEKNILSKEINEFLDRGIENKDDKEAIDSIFFQLQKVNEQIENIGWLNKHYKILHDFAQICSKTLNEDILLKKTYEMVSQVMPTDSFYIAYYTEGELDIKLLFLVDIGKVLSPRAIEFGDNYTSKVIKTRKIIHQKSANHPQEYDTIIGKDMSSSNLFVPVIIDDQVKGVISAQSTDNFAYRKEHEELLQLIGTQVINSVETVRLYDKIFLMSQTDELTSLKNHRAFHNDLATLINASDQEITLIMIDSDGLKKVNDNYGHDIGDLYLKVLADGIKSISDENIEGYRYAGDEFMIIIKSRMTDGIEQLHEKLMEYFLYNPIDIPNSQFNVSISAGIAFHPEHGTSVDALKKSADKALYVAKGTGGNQIVIAN